MDPERRRHIEELYNSAVKRSRADRAALLAGADPEIRGEVEVLLAQSSADTLLYADATDVMAESSVNQLAAGAQWGHYQIEEVLGRGEMGVVYRAKDTKVGREVAIKVLPDVFAQDSDWLARLDRDAKVLASLNHPNIGHVYAIESRAMVMELVAGETLSSITRPGPVPVETALNYARQIAEALEAAHERGIIHRDLKPANIMVTPAGLVKVLDFGLMKEVEEPSAASAAASSNAPTVTLSQPRAGFIFGTAAYLSPEQASGKAADWRADIWSFGAVLYEMLSGKRAFAGESASDTLATVLTHDPDWNVLPAETPTSIRTLMEGCLTKDRHQRVQAIREARIAVGAAIGARFWGRLEIRGRIGSGNFGEVYRAWDPDLRREVALKLASGGGHRQVAAVKEARALARVRHNNVVTVYGVDRHGDRVGLWMELIRGRTLAAIVKEHGPLGGREAALVGIELCRALAAVHAGNLVHGDVKAQNVMREEGGRIVVMDFGLVRNTEDAGTRQGGTPAYMAPELVGGAPGSVRSDIFALGVLLYYLVTGAFPTSKNARDTSHYAVNAKLLHDRRPDLLENFVQVIERALSPDPELRFPTAGGMLTALSNVLGSEHPIAPTPNPVKKLFKRAAAPGLALLTLALLAIVFAGPSILSSVGGWITGVAPGSKSQASIAVLPFENLSSSPDTEYLSEGIADDITSRLTRVKSLRVILVESSALRRLKAHDDLSKIAQELRVGTLLAGSVRKTGDTIRISVSLIDPDSKSYLWSNSYEMNYASFVDVGAEITRAVVPKLTKQLAGMQLPNQSSGNTTDSEAYKLYLKGRFCWNKRNTQEIHKAIGYFEEAVKADPGYALVYSGLSDCYSTLVDYGNLPADQGMPKAKAAAEKALQLDRSLAETQTSFAWVSALYDWNWAAAEASFLQALRLNPNYATAHVWYARFLTKIAHTDGAIVEAKLAADLDPLSLVVNTALGADLYFARRYDEARDQLLKTLDLEPGFMPAHFWLGRVYIRQQRYVEALAESEKAANADVGDRQLAQLLAGEIYAVSGRRTEALHIIDEWQLRRSQSSNVAASSFAVVYSSLGEKELTLEWLNRAYNERDSSLLTAQIHPAYDWLKSDPRFQEIFKRMGLPFKPLRKPGSPY
jgi:serine/threonine protein kinase/Tfp pilus assembly protein PilF